LQFILESKLQALPTGNNLFPVFNSEAEDTTIFYVRSAVIVNSGQHGLLRENVCADFCPPNTFDFTQISARDAKLTIFRHWQKLQF
jgi:hypothetical protein